MYLGENGSNRIAHLLNQVLERRIKGYMNIVNLAELYYILSRKNKKVADEKETNLRSFGIKIVPVRDNTLWREAAILKSNRPLSLADAFAAATAKILKSTLITGADSEFQTFGGIQIERVGVKD